MIRRLSFLTLISVIIVGLLMTVSTVIGSSIDTRAVVALVAPGRTRSAVNPTAKVALFDLNRKLRVNRPIPLPDVRQVAFNYLALDNVFVTTYSGDAQQQRYQADFYQYNYVTGKLTTIETVESDRQMNTSSGLFFSFSPLITQEGRNLTFINPVDRKPYRFDTATQQVSLLADLEISLMSAPNIMSWSPDDTKFSIRDADMFYVYNADGTQQLAYELNSADSYPYWSPDSRYIALQRPPASSGDLTDIIDVNTGREHELTKDFEGNISSWWTCDTPGIAYTLTTDQVSEGVLVNFQTGETIRLNDDPLLENESIEAIIALPDCTHFLLFSERFFPVNSSTQPLIHPLYLFDLTTKQATLIDQITTLVNYTDEAIYYETVDATSNQRQLMKVSLDALSDPVMLGEYSPVEANWLNWSTEMDVATYIRVSSGGVFTGELHLLNGQTGETHPLTAPDEYIDNHLLFLWSEIRNQE